MFKIADLLAVAIPPSPASSEWFQGAEAGVDYLVKNIHSEDIILFTNVGQVFLNSILVPLANVTPPDGDALQYADINPHARWALEHASGGGQSDRMYLSPPLDGSRCKSLEGAEQLVFRRFFSGVDKGAARTELSQKLVQALDLYWLDEEKAFCKLDEDGDIEPIIRLIDLSGQSGSDADIVITISSEQLHRYMAVTETALVMKFDVTRYPPGSFFGWGNFDRGQISQEDLFYHTGVQSNGSFANGAIILRPLLTKAMLIAKANADWSGEDKQYAIFKAHDWKNKELAEISCAPSALASYFDEGSPLPFQTTPAFFRPEVMQKYKADPEKYRLEHRSIHARGGWSLQTYDVNEAGQVHTYLCYLANLPYKEQLYWQSFNEWPKAPISKRAIETDFKGSFSTQPDPLVELKYEVLKLDKLKPAYWQPRGETLAATLHYPLTASVEEWGNAILALDQFIVEGFATKPLRQKLTEKGRSWEKSWGTIKLLHETLVALGLDDDDAADIMKPLGLVHHLRSKTKGHAAGSEKAALVRKAKTEHGSLSAHFRSLVAEVQTSFDRIVELM